VFPQVLAAGGNDCMNPSIQTRSAAVSHQLVPLVGSWLLLVLAVPLGLVGAVAAFFGAAYVTSGVLGLILVAILAWLLITSGVVPGAACALFRLGACVFARSAFAAQTLYCPRDAQREVAQQ
jgi:hypothetical protein